MNETNTKLLITVAALVVVTPIVLNGIAVTGAIVSEGISCGIKSIKNKRMIKKGLKDGSIVEIDGIYYEVKVEDIED